MVKRTNWWQTMVGVTILIEGDNSKLNREAATIGVAPSLREAFNVLFKKEVNPIKFSLSVDTFGSVYNTKKILERTKAQNPQPLFLIDLDCPKGYKKQRLDDNYYPEDWLRIFFMIQKMEAWILSQPEVIEQYGIQNNFFIKRDILPISNNTLIKNKHPEEISDPDNVIKTIFRQYFKSIKKVHGKPKPKNYFKTKDAPELIKLLNTQELRATFDEFQMLIDKINSFES